MTTNDNLPFRLAAMNGDILAVREMLEDPSVIAHISANANEAFRSAVKKGYTEIVKLLLAYPAVIAEISFRDNEAIISATEQGYFEIVQNILGYINLQEYANLLQTLIKAAATFNHADIVFYLLEKSNNNFTFDALLYTAIYGHTSLVNSLIDSREVISFIDKHDNQILRETALRGHVEIVKRLLDIPAVYDKVDAKNNFAFCAAVLGGHEQVMHELLKFTQVRENIAAQDNFAFRAAVYFSCNSNISAFGNFLTDLYFQTECEPMYYSWTYSLDNIKNLNKQETYKNILNHLLVYNEVLINVAANNNAALKSAAKGGDLDFVEYLLQFPAVIENIKALVEQYDIGGYVDSTEEDYFWLETTNISVIQRLLDFPEIMKGIALRGNYALQRVATIGNLEVFDALLQQQEVISRIGDVVMGIENEDEYGCIPHFNMNWLRSDNLAIVNRLLSYPAVRERIATSSNLKQESQKLLAELKY